MDKKKNFLTIVYELIIKYGIFVFAAGTVILNATLIFDNVVWGDEAFSCNIIRDTNLYGIFERVYYLENHPPLYYYTIRLFADIFGYKVWVYHLVSVLFFSGVVLLVVLFLRKRLGSVASAFIIAITGLSASFAEYNQEIRMYEECFFYIFVCVVSVFLIMKNYKRKYAWALLVIAGVASAYTHYYGLVTSGILLFVTSLAVFIINKKKTWAYGVITIPAYLILYSPWLFVLYKQIGYVSNSWWMTEPAKIKDVIYFTFGNGYTKYVFIPLFVGLIIFFIVSEITGNNGNTVKASDGDQENASDNTTKKGFSSFRLSTDAVLMIIFASAFILTLGFAYVVSYAFKPVFAARYIYPATPHILAMFMLAIKRVFVAVNSIGNKNNNLDHSENSENKKESDNSENKGNTNKQDKAANLELEAFTHTPGKIAVAVMFIFFLALLATGLLDFKYYRSVSKTESFQTEKTLSIVGTPSPDAVFTSQQVKHLSYTVLQYYYPNNEVLNEFPQNMDENIPEIWAFIGQPLSDDILESMEAKGYEVEIYPESQIAKYMTTMYHFKKK